MIIASISPKQLQRVYEERLRLDEDEWRNPTTRNGRFAAEMESFELISESQGRDMDKMSLVSDCGAGAQRIYDAVDYNWERTDEDESLPRWRERVLRQAILYLILIGKGKLAPTLTEIAENGSNREESIWNLM